MAKALKTIEDLTPDATIPERVVFCAAFPPIQSAIKVYGDRQGMRVQLDIPESEMGAAMSLFLWRECVLKVTVEPCGTGHGQGYGKKRDDLDKGPERKSAWRSPESSLAECAIGGGWESDS